MILVTGATGRVGSQLVRELAQMDSPFRALVRTKSDGEAIAALGGEPTIGNFDDAVSIRTALDGVRTAFLLMPLDAAAAGRTSIFVEQAKSAGVQRVVRLSAMGTGAGPAIPIAVAQREGELIVERSGLSWTHLRPNTFMTNFLFSSQSIIKEGALYAPAGSGATSFIDPRDISSAAVRVLTDDAHAGRIYELTGPEALTHHQVADAIGAAAGRPVKYVDIPSEMARSGMVDAGMNEWYVDRLIGFYDALKVNSFWSTVTTAVEELTGSPAKSLGEWAAEHASAFMGDASD